MFIETLLGVATGVALYQCHDLKREVFRLKRRLSALEPAEHLAMPTPLTKATLADTAPPPSAPAPSASPPAPDTSASELFAGLTSSLPEMVRGAQAWAPDGLLAAKAASETITSMGAPLAEMLNSRPNLQPSQAEPAPRAETPAAAPSALQNATTTLVQLVRANPFVSVGVLLVLVSFGFLFSLLAASNILPPAVRVALVALAGAAVFGYGTHQEKARPTFGMNLQGGAIALQFLCALWAYEGYDLVSPTTAFVWMGGLSAAAVAWAAHRKQGLFAFLGIAGSLVTPIVASTGGGTFSGLLAYCVWVSALGLGISRFLGMPTLMSTTLAGVAALLGAAMNLPEGSALASQVALLALLAGYVALSLSWTSEKYNWAERQRASIVGVLISAPLLVAGFLWSKAGVSAELSGILLGAVTALFLVQLRNASDKWQAWLLPISGGLGIVALAVGLDGASRAIAFSAGALGFVLIARAKEKRWMDTIAFAYWGLSVGLTMHDGVHGMSVPLIVSGLVALGAGFLTRRTLVGILYAVLAPVVLWHSVCADFPLTSTLNALWATGWAMGALFMARRLDWKELRLSTVWVPFAGLCFILSESMPSGPLLALREIAFVLWLTVTAFTIRTLDHEELSVGNIEGLSLAVPALISYELWRLLGAVGVSNEVLNASVAACWCAWCFVTSLPAVKFDFLPRVTGSIGAALLLAYSGFLPLNSAAEPLLWAGLAMLLYAARTRPAVDKRTNIAVIAGLGGFMLVSLALRAIGLHYGLTQSALALLFAREMQPWVSLLWAAAAIATVVWGSKASSRQLWMGGGIAIGVLLLKMLFVDLSTFSLAAKVGVFMVTGLAFIALGRYAPASPEAKDKAVA